MSDIEVLKNELEHIVVKLWIMKTPQLKWVYLPKKREIIHHEEGLK